MDKVGYFIGLVGWVYVEYHGKNINLGEWNWMATYPLHTKCSVEYETRKLPKLHLSLCIV